ncbi:hypothetical protein JCM11641_001838 [Rhodosporidiobolus odoratus]
MSLGDWSYVFVLTFPPHLVPASLRQTLSSLPSTLDRLETDLSQVSPPEETTSNFGVRILSSPLFADNLLRHFVSDAALAVRLGNTISSLSFATHVLEALELDVLARLGEAVREDIYPALQRMADEWLELCQHLARANCLAPANVSSSSQLISILPLLTSKCTYAPFPAPLEPITPASGEPFSIAVSRLLLDIFLLSTFPDSTTHRLASTHPLLTRRVEQQAPPRIVGGVELPHPAPSRPADAAELYELALPLTRHVITFISVAHSRLFLASALRQACSSSALFISPTLCALVHEPMKLVDPTDTSKAPRNRVALEHFGRWEQAIAQAVEDAEAIQTWGEMEAQLTELADDEPMAERLIEGAQPSFPYPDLGAVLKPLPVPTSRKRKRTKAVPDPSESSSEEDNAPGPAVQQKVTGWPKELKKLRRDMDCGGMDRRESVRRQRCFLNFLLVSALAETHSLPSTPAQRLPPIPTALSPAITVYRNFATTSAPNPATERATSKKQRVVELMRDKPYLVLPLRERHPHRRLLPTFLDSQGAPVPRNLQLEHHCRTRVGGLIAAEEAVYAAFPSIGINRTNIPTWTTQTVPTQFATRFLKPSQGLRWGSTACYGQSAHHLHWKKSQVALDRTLDKFIASIPTGVLPTFPEIRDLLMEAKLPGCAAKNSDLALSGYAQRPTRDEMARIVADVNRGARKGLVRLGFLSVSASSTRKEVDAATCEAFRQFFDALNASEAEGGISNGIRAALLSLNIDLSCPILLENMLCKIIRAEWKGIEIEDWLGDGA